MKYPRTPHFCFSPAAIENINDDKILAEESNDNFINKDLIVTEKLDGGNTCLENGNVYARSHQMKTSCCSFDAIKGRYNSIYYNLPKDISIYGENMYAIHSIEYKLLTDYFFVFSILKNDIFLNWYYVDKICRDFGLSVVPVLYIGKFSSIKELQNYLDIEIKKESLFGGHREGFVVRSVNDIHKNDFEKMIAKYVRKDHVQTNEHWSRRWRKSNIKNIK